MLPSLSNSINLNFWCSIIWRLLLVYALEAAKHVTDYKDADENKHRSLVNALEIKIE